MQRGGIRRQIANQYRRGSTGNASHIVVFCQPVAMIAALFSQTGEIERVGFKTLASDGIPKEQRAGIFVINKETVRVRLRCFTSFLDGNTIILLIFHDRNAMAAQFRFFPCPGISRHMNCHLKANAGAHLNRPDADSTLLVHRAPGRRCFSDLRRDTAQAAHF